ncbi:hypothetical protein BSL78_14556 [Apostichopus japonicus]|uniref:DNA topoisomerase n=1 Tax=Stichopus japonicus TaxID=307972 RepID=A0A2G8KKU1_STIJA|nr:hypothetical protein BSL78_14556 [Apostichopus japonicus]
MKTAFMVAEKPQLAQSLAKILSGGNLHSRKGFNGACSIHEYNGTFQGEPVKFKMTSVCGHVMGLDFLPKYNSWDKVDPSELFGAPTAKKEANPNLKMPHFLTTEGRGSDYLILWLDCDKEGENICFEVIDCVEPVMNRPRGREQFIFRAKFSAITDTDIRGAMNKLVEPNLNESLAVDARQELDLRIGCAFTRYQTKYFQGKYGDLDSTLISYGPCQTPTLGFCVERHDRIQTFKPEAYWVVHVEVLNGGQSVTLDWGRQRIFDKDVAQLFLNLVKGQKEAVVTSVSSEEKKKQRPIALNTVELMRVASASLGMSPHHAMQIAERLYTQGYISYPRTETTSYSQNFDFSNALRQQLGCPWSSIVRDLLSEGINKPRKGSDEGDHPPITPMRPAREGELTGEAWRIYEYIAKHFIATISDDCRYLQTTVKFIINGEHFSITGKKLISPGFTSLMTWQAITQEESVPDFTKGQAYPIDEARLIEKQTCPPDYLTEAELITLMEKHGIGTDASIPVHIENICQRNYVKVGGGRRLVPTRLGIVLVHGYHKIDPDLSLPTMRAAVEEQLNLIAVGKAQHSSVLQHALDIFKRKFDYFVEHIRSMDELFEVSFSPLAESGKPLTRCGKCRRYMKYIAAKPSRLHCAHCEETFSLPQNGVIKLYKELKCPLDNFELIVWSSGPKGKNFPLCPYCYSHPPFSDMRSKLAGCNECTHPSCQHSLTNLGVAQCFECEYGILVLDKTASPKWKLACNRCNIVVDVNDKAQKVSVAKETCKTCGASILNVDFKKGKSPLEGEETAHSGCIFCDPVLSPLVSSKHAVTVTSRSGAGEGWAKGKG